MTDARINELYGTDLDPQAVAADEKPVTQDWTVGYVMDKLKVTREEALAEIRKTRAAMKGETGKPRRKR